MKAIAYKRILREGKKRSLIAKTEKQERFFNFIAYTSTSSLNKLDLYYYIFRQKAVGRKSHCRHHCFLSGRGRSVYRHFRMTRNFVRELAHKGHIYGLKKASWLSV